MAEIVNTTYNDDSIQTLEWNEHIRRRAGMYIGRLGNGDRQGDGIYVLLKEIVDNSIDEFSMGFGKRIDITIEDKTVSVRDFGRGIPLNKVVDATSKLNTGGKFDDTNFKKSVGMNGVGTKAVNAMSVDFYVASYREGQCSYARFSRGILLESAIVPSNEKNGTFIRFTPDEEMFNDFSFHMEYVESMVKNYSYLKKGLTLNLNGIAYKSENGLLDLVNENMSETPLYPLIHLEGEDIEIVLTHGNSYGENIATFVNGQNTRDGGTHLAAYREAIAKTFKDFYKKDYKPEDIRQGIVGAISIQIQEPIFEGQTKTKLGSTYMWEKQVKGADGTSSVDRGPTIRTYVNDFVTKNLNDYLHMHMDIVPTIEDKIKASQAEREEIAGVQKKSRERAKKTAVYNRKLRDCRYHFSDNTFPKGMEDLREKTSIFITEGDSASGTITKVRDANTQAVFSLRGKP
ncbi:MAG: ATP-binding protein, partial [Bacteroidales bacterium]|nr:ATP-binding protein [Bacteroidales bacterium]